MLKVESLAVTDISEGRSEDQRLKKILHFIGTYSLVAVSMPGRTRSVNILLSLVVTCLSSFSSIGPP